MNFVWSKPLASDDLKTCALGRSRVNGQPDPGIMPCTA
jgi:hypothetical protein